MSWQPPPPPPRPQSQPSGSAPPKDKEKPTSEIDYYELLQVDRDAHATIIRYAYRFLAAMYHPDNGETGDAEKFRIISDAWRTLSDEGKRQAYDLSLGAKEQAGSNATRAQQREKPAEFGRDALPNIPKTNLTWNEIELRLAILQILLTARRKRPQTGGASGKMFMDILNIQNISEIEFALWYLREKGYLEMGERLFMITASGVDYLTEQLSKTQVLGGGSETEQKTTAAVTANLPATLR